MGLVGLVSADLDGVHCNKCLGSVVTNSENQSKYIKGHTHRTCLNIGLYDMEHGSPSIPHGKELMGLYITQLISGNGSKNPGYQSIAVIGRDIALVWKVD